MTREERIKQFNGPQLRECHCGAIVELKHTETGKHGERVFTATCESCGKKHGLVDNVQRGFHP